MENENRAALHQAHAARNFAHKRFDRESEISTRAAELAAEAAALFAQRLDEVEYAQSELSLTIAENLRAGRNTDIEPEGLNRCEEERDRARAKDQVAQRALTRVEADVKTARHALLDAQAKVRAAAVKILADEAMRRAIELRHARAFVIEHEVWLKAAGDLPLGELGRHLRPAVSVAMDGFSLTPVIAMSSVVRRLQSYLVALETDPSATWDAVAEPLPPVVGPQPGTALFRTSGA